MCMDIRKKCECGSRNVQFHMRDNILIPEVIHRLYCPECQGPESFTAETMINDNNWIIEYDMILARMLISRNLQIEPEEVTPELIFDQSFACWQEMFPGEMQAIKVEKKKIVELLKEDQKEYLSTIHQWNIDRIERLKAEGWRKVQMA